MSESMREEMYPLCRAYLERKNERRELLERRSKQQGGQIDENP
jgi:hypothetical protein